MTLYNPGSDFSVGSNFGTRTDPFNHTQTQFHGGTDYSAANGTPVPAAAGGTVWYSGLNGTEGTGGGNTVIIQHIGADGTPFYTTYMHLNGTDMPTVGATVSAGDIIGQVGSTGRSTGSHLHFEIVTDTTPTNGDGGPLGYSSRNPAVHPNPSTFNNWPGSGAYSAPT